MTAVTKYTRLEASGLWRESPESQRRDVAVALGDATIVITDATGTALAHWSLPAVIRLNPGEVPALYAPDPDAAETLEIDDQIMISAIATVHAAIARRRPQRGRLRAGLTLGLIAVLVAISVFWLPDALIRYTASVVPDATRQEIGIEVQSRITRVAGPPCQSSYGSPALAKLDQRLGGDGVTLRVLPTGPRNAAHIPGGAILLNKALVEDFEGPEVAAGHVIAERARAAAEDPLVALLHTADVGAAVRLLTTGKLPADALDRYAESLMTQVADPVDPSALLAMFRAAGVTSTPYAYAVDVSGEATVELIEADPVPTANRAPLLADEDWVALQGICGG